MQQQYIYIIKEDFIFAFQTVFRESLTENNIKGGFRGTGFVSFDPEKIISAFDLKLQIPISQNSRPSIAQL